MKNMFRKNKRQRATGYFLLFTLFLLFCGCNDSSRTPYTPSGTAYSDDLMSEAIQIVRDGLADENPLIRANTIEVVAATKHIRLMPKVQRLLKDPSVPVAFAAALAIGDLQYSLAKSEVAPLIKDENENIRIAAVYAMRRLAYPGGFELLQKAVASNDQTVRANAVLLLGKSGDKSALKFLYWALQHKDSDDKVRFQAAEAIAMLGDERIYPKLWAMLISTYADDRVMGVRAMGALGIVKAKNALFTMLDDDILEVRLAAAEQLGKLGDATGEPEVLDVLTKNLTEGMDKEGVERIKVLTALAIGQICTEPLTKFLPRLLRDESKFVRIAAAKAVLQCSMKN
jgi:HEAT repeat protein